MPKRFRGNLNIGRVVAVLVVFLVVVGAGIALLWVLFGSKDLKLVYSDIPLDSGMSYRVNNGTISYLNNNQLFTYSQSGGKNDTVQLTTEVDGYAVRDKKCIVYDGGMVHISGVASPVQLTGTVRDARLGKDYIAVLRTNSQGMDSIVIFDYQGNTIGGEPLDFSDSKVTGFDFYTENNRELLWVVSVETNQGIPVTTVKMYDYGAGGSISNLSPFYDQAVEKLYFSENSIFVVGTQDIVRYAINGGKEKYRIPIYGNRVVDMAVDEDMVTFLLLPRNENEMSSFRFIRATETDEVSPVTRQCSVPDPIKGAFLQDSGIRVVCENNLYIFGYSGKLVNTIELEHHPLSVYKLDELTLLLVCDNGLYKVTAK